MSDIANLKHRLRSEIPQRGDISLQELAASGIEQLETEIERLKVVLKGVLVEWDNLTRYGSPIAKAANERVAAAIAALERKP